MHNETVRGKPDPRSQACMTPGCDLVYRKGGSRAHTRG